MPQFRSDEEMNMSTVREAIEEMRRSIAMDRWALRGVCAIGAWLIYLMTSQLAEFKATLGGITTTMVQVQLSAERVAVKVEALERPQHRE